MQYKGKRKERKRQREGDGKRNILCAFLSPKRKARFEETSPFSVNHFRHVASLKNSKCSGDEGL